MLEINRNDAASLAHLGDLILSFEEALDVLRSKGGSILGGRSNACKLTDNLTVFHCFTHARMANGTEISITISSVRTDGISHLRGHLCIALLGDDSYLPIVSGNAEVMAYLENH